MSRIPEADLRRRAPSPRSPSATARAWVLRSGSPCASSREVSHREHADQLRQVVIERWLGVDARHHHVGIRCRLPELTKVVDEVIDRLAQQTDVRLKITVLVEAEHSGDDGFADDTVRTISENAKTLRFKDFGWDKE